MRCKEDVSEKVVRRKRKGDEKRGSCKGREWEEYRRQKWREKEKDMNLERVHHHAGPTTSAT